jgi:hypothetical protein
MRAEGCNLLRYKLRTLLIVMAILPPLLWIGWTKYEAWRVEQARREQARQFAEQRNQERLAAMRASAAAMRARVAADRAELQALRMTELETLRAEGIGPNIPVVPSVRQPELAPNEL